MGAIGPISGSASVPSGTAFPLYRSVGDRFWRTDILGGMEFAWNGTRWVSTTLYSHPFGPGDHVLPFVGPVISIGRLALPFGGTYDIWVQTIDAFTYVISGNGAIHYWTISVVRNPSASALGSFTTGADTSAVWTRHSIAVNALNGTSDVEMEIVATYTDGAVGGIYVGGQINYRVVGT